MNPTTFARRAGVAALACVLVAGCSASPAPTSPSARVLPHAEARRAVQQCMLDRGWEVTLSDDGGIGGFAPSGQEDRYEADLSECSGTVRERTYDEYSHEELRRIYESFAETRACQNGRGGPYPDPPSYQAWTESKGSWNPYSDLPDEIGGQALLDLEASCPMIVP